MHKNQIAHKQLQGRIDECSNRDVCTASNNNFAKLKFILLDKLGFQYEEFDETVQFYKYYFDKENGDMDAVYFAFLKNSYLFSMRNLLPTPAYFTKIKYLTKREIENLGINAVNNELNNHDFSEICLDSFSNLNVDFESLCPEITIELKKLKAAFYKGQAVEYSSVVIDEVISSFSFLVKKFTKVNNNKKKSNNTSKIFTNDDVKYLAFRDKNELFESIADLIICSSNVKSYLINFALALECENFSSINIDDKNLLQEKYNLFYKHCSLNDTIANTKCTAFPTDRIKECIGDLKNFRENFKNDSPLLESIYKKNIELINGNTEILKDYYKKINESLRIVSSMDFDLLKNNINLSKVIFKILEPKENNHINDSELLAKLMQILNILQIQLCDIRSTIDKFYNLADSLESLQTNPLKVFTLKVFNETLNDRKKLLCKLKAKKPEVDMGHENLLEIANKINEHKNKNSNTLIPQITTDIKPSKKHIDPLNKKPIPSNNKEQKKQEARTNLVNETIHIINNLGNKSIILKMLTTSDTNEKFKWLSNFVEITSNTQKIKTVSSDNFVMRDSNGKFIIDNSTLNEFNNQFKALVVKDINEKVNYTNLIPSDDEKKKTNNNRKKINKANRDKKIDAVNKAIKLIKKYIEAINPHKSGNDVMSKDDYNFIKYKDDFEELIDKYNSIENIINKYKDNNTITNDDFAEINNTDLIKFNTEMQDLIDSKNQLADNNVKKINYSLMNDELKLQRNKNNFSKINEHEREKRIDEALKELAQNEKKNNNKNDKNKKKINDQVKDYSESNISEDQEFKLNLSENKLSKIKKINEFGDIISRIAKAIKNDPILSKIMYELPLTDGQMKRKTQNDNNQFIFRIDKEPEILDAMFRLMMDDEKKGIPNKTVFEIERGNFASLIAEINKNKKTDVNNADANNINITIHDSKAFPELKNKKKTSSIFNSSDRNKLKEFDDKYKFTLSNIKEVIEAQRRLEYLDLTV